MYIMPTSLYQFSAKFHSADVLIVENMYLMEVFLNKWVT